MSESTEALAQRVTRLETALVLLARQVDPAGTLSVSERVAAVLRGDNTDFEWKQQEGC